jgi:DNA polymerase II large subunit
MAEASSEMQKYFKSIDEGVDATYALASLARSKGFDPEKEVSVPIAKNMAERVEGIISTVAPSLADSGLSIRIKELEEQYGSLDWRVALVIAQEVAMVKFGKFETKLAAMETGIRVGIAYLTLGIVASPIEGFVELKLPLRKDGKPYFSLMYSGPIRSAGGTAAAVSVVVADYVRVKMGYDAYVPTDKEIQRNVTELQDYHDRVTNLQYLPSGKEVQFLMEHLPVQVNGDPSEKIEVSNYKDLERVETNRIRSGVCLVMGEGIAQKAKKVHKQLSSWSKEFGLEHWDFLKDFLKLQQKEKAQGKEEDTQKIVPVYTFISDIVAGRPVLTHPLRPGGFRLRYGRSRASGYSSAAIHPATSFILNQYIAVGTQLKVERPGKAAALTCCDSIEGPIVLLKDGTVRRLHTLAEAKQHSKETAKILFLGDLLFNYGDFFNRAHTLIPAGYCEEWWIQELELSVKKKHGSLDFEAVGMECGIDGAFVKSLFADPLFVFPTAKQALALCKTYSVRLHPRHTYHWNILSFVEFTALLGSLQKGKVIAEGEGHRIVFAYEESFKSQLEVIGVPHKAIANEHLVLEGDEAAVFVALFYGDQKKFSGVSETKGQTTTDLLNEVCSIQQQDKSGVFIGARMGRPEKAKMRKLAGSPHVLFPVGDEGGKLRSFQSSMEKGKITAELKAYYCGVCKSSALFGVCERCNTATVPAFVDRSSGAMTLKQGDNHSSYHKTTIPIRDLFQKLRKDLKEKVLPDLIKGVRGTSNRDHTPEHLSKGILRAKHNVYVNKDGTTRYDMTQLVITHFKPLEIGTSVERLRELGYGLDCYGKPLVDDNQILELKPQDIVLPACPESPEEGADEILFRTTKFLDDLLVKLYGVKAFYKLKSTKDLAGHLVNALAPHTSSSVVARIVGFSKTQGFLAHPMLHAATRRDCDGDEASVTLLLDTLLNFSRQFLPNTRGATQDASLVLTSRVIPSEVDDMVFDVDVVWKYPLSFYEAALAYKGPWEVEIEQLGKRLNTPAQYEGMGFTHGISNINEGVMCSAYKTLPSMQEKLQGQMDLADRIRAVDEADVARLVIDKHFIRDIKGNLRKFSQQQFRCSNCNTKYRRPPLIGRCTECHGTIIFTISQGSIVKYLEPAISLATRYNLDAYMQQSLDLVKRRVEGVFGREPDKQVGLGSWF